MVPNQKNDIKGFAIYVELASLGAEMFAPIAIGAFLILILQPSLLV